MARKDGEINKCLTCEAKLERGKYQNQDCHKRSVMYQTFCISYESKEDDDEIDKACGDDNKKVQEIKRFEKIQ